MLALPLPELPLPNYLNYRYTSSNTAGFMMKYRERACNHCSKCLILLVTPINFKRKRVWWLCVQWVVLQQNLVVSNQHRGFKFSIQYHCLATIHASLAVLSLWFTVTCRPIIEFHENDSLYATSPAPFFSRKSEGAWLQYSVHIQCLQTLLTLILTLMMVA